MSNIELLDQTRRLSLVLTESDNNTFEFNKVCDMLKENIKANVILLSNKGKVLGLSFEKECKAIEALDENTIAVGGYIDSVLNGRLKNILSTKENLRADILGFENLEECKYSMMATPLILAQNRLGTLLVYRQNEMFSIADIINVEYAATIFTLELMRALDYESSERRRSMEMVSQAVGSLSASERKAMLCLLEELHIENEGVLVTSKIADKIGITRSIIINALRKLESAGIISCQSYGMKGTHIQILNPYIYELAEIHQN